MDENKEAVFLEEIEREHKNQKRENTKKERKHNRKISILTAHPLLPHQQAFLVKLSQPDDKVPEQVDEGDKCNNKNKNIDSEEDNNENIDSEEDNNENIDSEEDNNENIDSEEDNEIPSKQNESRDSRDSQYQYEDRLSSQSLHSNKSRVRAQTVSSHSSHRSRHSSHHSRSHHSSHSSSRSHSSSNSHSSHSRHKNHYNKQRNRSHSHSHHNHNRNHSHKSQNRDDDRDRLNQRLHQQQQYGHPIPVQHQYNREKRILEEDERLLRKGSIFLKYGRMGDPHFRFVHLYNNSIHWTSISRSGKHAIKNGGRGFDPKDVTTKCSISLEDVHFVTPNKNTPVFERKCAVKAKENRCLSIWTNARSLDLECRSHNQREEWVLALSRVVRAFHGLPLIDNPENYVQGEPDLPIEEENGQEPGEQQNHRTKINELKEECKRLKAEVKYRESQLKEKSDNRERKIKYHSRTRSTPSDDLSALLLDPTDGVHQEAVWRECAVCMESPWDTSLIPCGHVLCSKCANLEKCPFCAKTVKKSMRLFVP